VVTTEGKMEFRILGRLEVVAGDHPVAVTAAKPRALLALLLLHPNEPVASDRLIDELWGGRPPPSARKVLQTYVMQLRRALGDGMLVTQPAGYELHVEPGALDLQRFEALVTEARESDPGVAALKLREALALWRGPPFADFIYEPFAQREIARLEELRLAALEERIEADLALGRHAELVGELEALLAEHPLRERLRGQLMLALYRSGRQSEALKVYRDTRSQLVDELGIEPSPTLQDLERAILAQDPALDVAPVPERASGTVTFLFTDLEGSTALLRRLGRAVYGDLLSDQHGLIRGELARHQGEEIDVQGDSLFAAFRSAAEAVAAGVAIQRSMAEHSWPEGVSVRARVGIHTGEATVADNRYLGLSVHRAARIGAAGHGGQVLLSATTRALLVDEELPGIGLRDLGEHRLKDFDRPERLYQLEVEGLPQDFPPLTTVGASGSPGDAVATPGMAGRQSSPSFIGRKKELREIRRLLRRTDTRLVTLAGAGGTGKTRLAFEICADLGSGFRDGAAFVELASITDPGLVAATVASAFGLREVAGRGAAEALGAFLRGRELLLVLDNFEQVLPAGSLVTDLLEQAPALKILVTSRAPLRVATEQMYPVPPLDLPEPRRPIEVEKLRRTDAVSLFVERAREARSDFELSDVNAAAVVEICRRLDGLPLALELAAARVRLLSPRAIVSRLGRRLDLLRAEAPEAPERHRTLRAAIEWSYHLLHEDEQRLFPSLGVFVGGFTLDAAEAVVGGPDLEVLDSVDSLLDSSLLRPERTAGDEPRVGMLETIRDYALERLADSADGEVVRHRHAAFYLKLAEDAEPELRGPFQVSWLERLVAEHENLRAALEWATATEAADIGLAGAAALWRFWQVRGLLGEGRERLERLLALDARDVSAAVRARARASAGRVAFMQGDYESARRYLEESLPVQRQLGDQAGTTMTLALLGNIAHVQGDDRSAQKLVEESVSAGRASRDWWAQSQALRGLGDLRLALQEPEKARLAFEESLRAAREAGDRRNIALLLGSLGRIALSSHEHDCARALFEEGFAVAQELGDTWNIARSLDNLGLAARARGQRAAARRLLGEALALQAETDERPGIATTLELLAELAVEEGRGERAVRLYSAASLLREEFGDHPMQPAHRDEARIGAVRAAIGEEAFTTAWANGRSMMLDQVIAYAQEAGGEADVELVQPSIADA
jgi:predicted ATPase/DNA-binding SARP family transcriptional activator